MNHEVAIIALKDAKAEIALLKAKIRRLERKIETQPKSIWTETAADIAARPPRPPIIDYDKMREVLQGKGAQELASLILEAAAKARKCQGKITNRVFSDGTISVNPNGID
jgi:hypothetical protein